ncbi:hypothetical protein [Streptomyces sp. NBC_00576]|uniref:hypothetical protein n=1 Tax=Streptomyces sp. NBC_00576 TaxID=2903665 RepID=UPI002E7FDF31|nr:hypothetical protein [Streptomyces sp. NBC_00576]WUB72721.1 hypothetical protein OG734_22875 [Streptomyces sp. NBC_00576]
MYAIHLETPHCKFGQNWINLCEVAALVPRVSTCRIEHVHLARHHQAPNLGAIFLTAESAAAAGSGVLVATRELLAGTRRTGRSKFHIPAPGRRPGLCHGVVSVFTDPCGCEMASSCQCMLMPPNLLASPIDG